MTIFGSGSEWFWAMAQFVLVAVTLLGLYRQIRQGNAANALHRIETLQGEWNSPRLAHARLVTAIWRKHSTGGRPDPDARVAITWLANFFENLSDLNEEGYLSWKEIDNSWRSSLINWWAILSPTIVATRQAGGFYSGFERLASMARAAATGDPENVSSDPTKDIPDLLDRAIRGDTARLRMLREIETGQIPAEPAATTAVTPKHTAQEQ